jgi:hypothetical protein
MGLCTLYKGAKMKGICCTCQQKTGVHRSTDSGLSESDKEELEHDTDPLHPFRWVCDSHEAFGSHCEGSCLTPQFVFREKE